MVNIRSGLIRITKIESKTNLNTISTDTNGVHEEYSSHELMTLFIRDIIEESEEVDTLT